MKCTRITAWIFLVMMLLTSIAFPVYAENIREAPPEILEGENLTHKYLVFGSYEQDNNLENGPEPIEWLVLKVEEGRALVISRYALKLMQYHNTIAADESVMWETWDVRAWLKEEFLQTAFTEAELERILTTTVEAQRNSFSADQGNDTEDKMFLLSYNEASKYFKGGKARKCQPTAYAIACYEAENEEEWEMISDGTNMEYPRECRWWLRTPGEFPGSATFVSTNGALTYLGENVLRQSELELRNYGVRPAMWIDLEP